MIEIVPLSPENELPIAEGLRKLVIAEWPDLSHSPAIDRIRIFVGVRLSFEIDLLVEISLAKPRPVSAARMRGSEVPPASSMLCGLLAIEVKQQSRECFEIDGPEIFPVYGRTRSTRSIGKQINDGVIGARNFLKRYTDENPFIHGLGWLTDMPESELRAVPAYIVGREATWSEMLQAAATRQPILFADPSADYRRAVETFGNVLANKRRVPPRDRPAVNRLTNAVIANGKFEEIKAALGSRQVRLAGRAGSGKSTTVALLAEYVARVRQERLLVLTYNHALCHEIDRLIRSVVNDDALVDRHVRVTTLVDFLAEACTELGADIARVDNHVDFQRLDDEFRAFLDREPAEERREEAAILKELEPERYAFDYVCVDEAQDCLDTERDLLRILYAPDRMVLADGMDQLVRRQTPCDWTTSVKPAGRLYVDLAQSLRMSRNIAEFANATAKAMGLEGWRITPHPELSGGRIVILPRRYDREFFVAEAAKYREPYRADYCALVAPAFDTQLTFASEMRAHGVAAWTVDDFVRAAALRLDCWQMRELFASGYAASALDDIAWAQIHGPPKRLRVIASLLVQIGLAQQRMAHDLNDTSPPRLTVDVALIQLDARLNAAGSTNGPTREEVDAAFTWLTSPYVGRAIWTSDDHTAIVVRPPFDSVASQLRLG